MQRIVILLSIVTALMLVAACGPVSQADQTDNRVIYGLTLSPSGFDPHIHQSSELGIVLRQVYDTLIYRDPNTGQFIPGLATAWDISDDQTEYTFTLRQGVRFHDDTPFNAAAVGANLDRITDPLTRSQHAVSLLGTYIGYDIIDEYTILLRLSEPFSPLLDSLSQVYLGIASPDAIAEYSTDRYQFHQVGTGPFTFEEYIPDQRLVIARNPNYAWGPDFYSLPAENALEIVEFRFFVDPVTRLAALETDEAHIIGELPPTDARSLTGSGNIQMIPAAIGGQPDQFLINTVRFPTDNVVFRRALIYGTNRQIISDTIYQGFSSAAWGPITPNTQFYNRSVNEVYDFDLRQARALLASLGYVDNNSDGILDVGENSLTVRVLVPPWGENRQIAQVLQDQWRSLGIEADLVPVPDFPTLLREIETGEYNLVSFNTSGLDPAFLNSYYTTDGVRNWSNFSSPDIDNILASAERQVDSGVRTQLYAQAQQLIMDQALVLPIRERVNLNAADSSIQNLRFDAYGWFPILVNAQYTPR